MILLQETISAESITAVTFPGVFSFQKPFFKYKVQYILYKEKPRGYYH